MKKLLLAYSLVILCSCTPRITTSLIKSKKPLPKNTIVAVYNKNDTLLDASEKLGTTRVNDNASTAEFDYNSVVELAKVEAGKAGGNAIRIIKHQLPNLLNTGHEVYADIIKMDTGVVHQRQNQKIKEEHNIIIPYSH